MANSQWALQSVKGEKTKAGNCYIEQCSFEKTTQYVEPNNFRQFILKSKSLICHPASTVIFLIAPENEK